MRLRMPVFFAALMMAVAGSGGASAQTVASAWVDHVHAKSRLVAAEHGGQIVAFVEIALPEGWKTYWRNPGDTGGLPPTFDFKGSDNVLGTRVLFPAPQRLIDRAGETIGYKGTALFPVEVDAAAAGKAVVLRLNANFGVCHDICVPLQATHELKVEPGIVGPADGALRDALARVPKASAGDDTKLPAVKAAEVVSLDAPSTIAITAAFPGGADAADMFVEAPDGLYVPMPKRTGAPQGDIVTFHATFSSKAEMQQIIGKPLKVTLTGKGPASETTVTIE